MTAAGFHNIEVREDGAVAYLRFDRPEHRNGVTAEMLVEVYDALSGLAPREDIDVVVLTGNGRTFCPGADLSRSGSTARTEAGLPPHEAYRSAELLHTMPQVTMAAVNGACAGAGFAWAAACDLRIAAASARFAVSFLELGLSSELGLVWNLERQLGGAIARNLLFLLRKLTAAELRELHFVADVVADEDFEAETRRLATELAGRGSDTLRMAKRSLLEAAHLPLSDYLTVETARHQDRFRGAAAEGTRSRLAAQAARVLHPKGS